MVTQTVLATLSGSAPHRRLQVVLSRRGSDCLGLDLREQHYAEGIGWFDQRVLELDFCQIRQLRAALDRKWPAFAVAEAEPLMTLPFSTKGRASSPSKLRGVSPSMLVVHFPFRNRTRSPLYLPIRVRQA